MERLQLAWNEVREQWASQARLRAGVWVALFIVWLHGITLALDHIEVQRRETSQLQEELGLQQALSRQAGLWPQRLRELQQAQEALHALVWSEADRGVAEASMQDWLITLAARSGVKVREQTLVRPDAALGTPAARGTDIPGTGTASSGAGLPARYAPMRIRLVAEFNARAASNLLAELGRADKLLRVDRLRIGTLSQPPILELEATGVVRLAERSPR